MNNLFYNIDWAVAMRTDVLTCIFKGFTILGYSTLLLPLIIAGYWSWDKKIFSRALLWLIFTALVNGFLKEYFMDPRPDAVYHLDTAMGQSYGFPSGHAQMAVVIWFWIAWEIRKKWVWLLCSVIVAGICFSRLYLGVHDVEDVLGGAAIGLVLLFFFKFISGKRFYWWVKVRPVYQVGAIVLVELIVLILWPANRIPGKFIAYSVFLAVFWSGVLYERQKVRFVFNSKLVNTIAAVVIGLFIFILIRLAFKKMMNCFAGFVLQIQVAEAVAGGIYLTIIAPRIFQVLHLARKDQG